MASLSAETGTQNRAHTSAGPLLWLATVTMGIAAGVYFTFSVGIIPGLSASDDRTFVIAMQEIIVAIENPVFFLVFFGALLLSGAAAIVHGRSGLRVVAAWEWAAFVCYAVSLAITFFVSVPLNDDLVAAGHPDQISDIGTVVADFEGPWVVSNIGRVVAGTLALVCLAFALAGHGRETRQRANNG